MAIGDLHLSIRGVQSYVNTLLAVPWRTVEGMSTNARDPQRWHRLSEASGGRCREGGELMNKTEEMMETYGDTRA